MNRLRRRFDGALFDGWTATPKGLAAFRIVFALSAGLFTMPVFGWITEVPPELFRPPLGPLRLLPSLPPDLIVHGLKVVLVLCLVALLIGYRTSFVSWATSITWLFVAGLSFSFGKINHMILPAIVPAIFAFSGWGGAWSVDSWRGKVVRVRTWPFALLGVCVGVSMAYASYVKVSTGWLQPGSQASYGHLIRQVVGLARNDLLAPYALRLSAPALWELVDWTTVLVEASMIVLWVRRSTTQGWALVATCFHFVVFLTLNIPFVGNVIAYAAWLPWTSIADRVGTLLSILRPPRALVPAGVVMFGLACLLSTYPFGMVALGKLPILDATQAAIAPLGAAALIACAVGLRSLRSATSNGAPKRPVATLSESQV